jgi:ribosomal protein S15P/S13E
MSTTLLSSPFSKTDLIYIWISYFKRRNEYEEEVIDMNPEDFEIMLNDIYNLLKHVEYQDKIIDAQSRKVCKTTLSKIIWRS